MRIIWLDTTQESNLDTKQYSNLDTNQDHNTCIPPQFMRTYIGLDTTQCPNLIRHKSSLDTTQVLILIQCNFLTWYHTSMENDSWFYTFNKLDNMGEGGKKFQGRIILRKSRNTELKQIQGTISWGQIPGLENNMISKCSKVLKNVRLENIDKWWERLWKWWPLNGLWFQKWHFVTSEPHLSKTNFFTYVRNRACNAPIWNGLFL